MQKRIISVLSLLAVTAIMLICFSDGIRPVNTTKINTFITSQLGAAVYQGQEDEIIPEETSLEEIMIPLSATEELELVPISENLDRFEGIEETMLTFGDYIYELSDEELAALQERLAKEEEYSRLALCKVPGYVNIRSMPSTDGEILGKIYQGAVAEVIELSGENMDWFHITSGSVEGYIKASFFISGDEAVDAIDDYVKRYATVNVSTLNVRKGPSKESEALGYLSEGEKAVLLEDCGEWLRIQYKGKEEGYVASKYAMISEEFQYAISIEEERKEQQRLKELEERKKAAAAAAIKEEEKHIAPVNTNYATTDELRNAIVDYALQFVGGPYKSGGNSLTKGTDCSGFTMLIYAEFGYTLSRTPTGQMKDGKSVSLENIEKGDVICYGKNGKCTHVGIYIGDGKIVHAANKRSGICTSSTNMEPILGVRRIFE